LVYRPAALVLDEFQAIVGLGAHLPGLLKALADAHPEVVADPFFAAWFRGG